MLYEFLAKNRDDLIQRCRAKVARRVTPKATGAELDYGIPLFLDQLIQTLELEQNKNAVQSRRISGPSGGTPVLSAMGISAKQHGRELLERGFTVDQVVHDYGDLCQAVTDAAYEQGVLIEVDEFRTLNRCLDNAIAESVTEYSYQTGVGMNERLGVLAHEVRNLIHTATLALMAIKTGKVALDGATGAVLSRSLQGVSQLIDTAVGEVRVIAGMQPFQQPISLFDFIHDVEIAASLESTQHGCTLVVAVVDPKLGISVDKAMLMAALANLLQNAFKFTHAGTEVSLNAYAAGDRVRIDVEDNCGGLPPRFAETMFLPFTQGSPNKTGLGLGLSISRRSIEANQGVLSVRDAPGVGCVFTVDLPRHALTVQ